MEFLALLKLLHILGMSVGAAACLMLMQRLCAGNSPALARRQITQNLRPLSYAMLAGVLLLSFSAGALFAHHLLTTSALPANGIMGLRIASLAGIAVGTVLLHVYLIPARAGKADTPGPEEKPLVHMAALALAASAILVSWVLWMLSGLDASELQGLTVMHVTSAAVALTLVIWCELIVFVIGNRFAALVVARRHRADDATAMPARRSMPEFNPAHAMPRQRASPARRVRFRISSHDLKVPAPAAR